MSRIDSDEGVARAPIAHWRTIMLVVTAALGAAVLVALIATLGAANRQRDRALELQSHSYEVMVLASNVSGTIANAEASLGRYVISGDKQIGQLYSDQWSRAGDQLDQLDRATADDPAQQRRIDTLRRAYKARGEELSLTALNTAYHQNNQALARYYKARKAESLAQINRLLIDIIGSERALLISHSTAVAQSLSHSNNLVHVLVGFGMVIVLGAMALGWMAVQALSERAAARAEAEIERERVEDLEAAVAAATAELKLQEARLRQVQKMEAVGQLTGGIAHDFNNMLAVVLGGLELAQRNLPARPDEVKRHIANAMEGANRAATLTRRLLAFSRAEPLLPEAIAAGALIAGMSNLLDRTLGDAITVETRDSGMDWAVWVDRHQLENAILNLAVNARDAMDGRGTLTIATGGTTLAAGAIGDCPAGDYVTIAVSDTGCGMTPDVLERVFEPFFTTKPVGKGTGLGLSQIFGFVRQSDGEIGLDSVPGGGTTVTVYLPRRLSVSTAAPREIVASEARPAALAGLDVLVVEDDPRVLAATMSALEELGHHPVGCGDPLQAPDLLESQDAIDLIVSDVLMPGQTGPEMIAALTPLYPHIAVLFVTGYAGEVAGDVLCDHIVLRKPFTITALEQAIGEVMAIERPTLARRIAAE
ncbi:response regulator [Sphingomonas koreensis]|nr:response regulator [Sphingomonas koreensis]